MPSAKADTQPSSRITGGLTRAVEKPEYGILLILCAVGVLLRLPQLGASFYGDEAFSLLRDSSRLITDTEDRFRPLFFSLLYLWRQLGFHGEIGLRLLPLLFGLAQIPAAYFIGLRLGQARLARAFAVLVAASPLLIEFSQELRMYSMVALLALLQTLAYLRLIERPTLGRILTFVLVAVIGVYTHLHYWLFLAGFAPLFLMERRALPVWKGWGTLAVILALYLPNLPNIQRFAEVRGGDYGVHLQSALPKLIAAFMVGFNYIAFGNEAAGRPVGLRDVLHNVSLFVAVLVPVLVILWQLGRLHLRKPFPRTLLIGHALFTIPVLLALAATVVTKQYWLQPKYIIFSAPFALLLIAEAYFALSPPVLRRGVAVLGLAVCAVALLHFWTPTRYGRREDWRGAARYLQEHMKPTSRLILVPSGYGLLNYYWPNGAEHWTMVDPDTAARVFDAPTRALSADNPVADFYYLWSDIRRNESDPEDKLLEAFRRGTWAKPGEREIQFNPRLKLYHAYRVYTGADERTP